MTAVNQNICVLRTRRGGDTSGEARRRSGHEAGCRGSLASTHTHEVSHHQLSSQALASPSSRRDQLHKLQNFECRAVPVS